MISCLCVTRGDRRNLLENAIVDFTRQSFADRELLILHDGDDTVAAAIDGIAARQPQIAPIRVERIAPGTRLGGLRNIAIERASGDWICQWDDDDRHHPERLALQWDDAHKKRASVGYLVDQLHWFPGEGLLFWDDWNSESYPMNLIQGTILARRDVLPAYPDLPRGEDTLHTHALLRKAARDGFGVSRLRGVGWCYVYTYHGGNVWDLRHHQAISRSKHLPPAALLPRLAELRKRLTDYSPNLGNLCMPCGNDTIRLPG